MFGGRDEASPGDSGVTYRSRGMYLKKDAFSDPTLLIAVDAAADVGKMVAAAWLYDKIEDKEVSIETARGTYEATREGIEAALSDILEDE